MTQVFGEDGRAYPATVISAAPNMVTQVKTTEKDGYSALQIGFHEQKESRVTKPLLGHMKKSGGIFRHLRELRDDVLDANVKVGDKLTLADLFKVGDRIAISGVSKGKGFQGVVKRHGFHGGPRSHGQKHTERAPGSIGAGGPQRVFKGTKMAGRMGNDRVTIKRVQVLQIDPEKNVLVVKGSVPGRRGTLLELRGN